VVIVPFLAWRLEHTSLPADSVMVVAVATSLASIVATSLSAIRSHHRRGAIHWPTVAKLAPGILIGSSLGSGLAHVLPGHLLKLIFSLFLFLVGLSMLRKSARSIPGGWNPGVFGNLVASLGIGAISAMLGIGGGTLSVPYLHQCRFSMVQAVAISGACGLPIALAGSVTYFLLSREAGHISPQFLGYIHLPALAGIIATSVPCAPLGARLAHALPTSRLKQGFAVVVLAHGHAHGTTAHHMQMQMKHHLTAVFAAIDHRAVTVLGQPLLFRHSFRRQQ
jgi:uncharacterized membrane protein YfcA